MKFNLNYIKKSINDFKRGPIGNDFLDQRIEEMRNPQGYVADYYKYFYVLAKEYKPSVIVELGSWQGTSAACFAAGSPSSLVITIDHHTDPGDDQNKLRTLGAAANFENLKYVQGWTCDQLYNEEKDKHSITGQNAFPEVVKLLDGKKIDILFIDSWHRFDQAMKDWNAYEPLLADEALVICDDICPGVKGGGIEDMHLFWDEMEGEKFLDGTLHGGFPQGYLKYERKTN